MLTRVGGRYSNTTHKYKDSLHIHRSYVNWDSLHIGIIHIPYRIRHVDCDCLHININYVNSDSLHTKMKYVSSDSKRKYVSSDSSRSGARYNVLHLQCHFFFLKSQSMIKLSRSPLQRSVEKRRM